MSNQKEKWPKRVLELAGRSWVVEAIRGRLNYLRENG